MDAEGSGGKRGRLLRRYNDLENSAWRWRHGFAILWYRRARQGFGRGIRMRAGRRFQSSGKLLEVYSLRTSWAYRKA